LRNFKVTTSEITNKPASEFFTCPNAWILDRIKIVEETRLNDISVDAELAVDRAKVSINLTVLPLMSDVENGNRKKLGALLMIEDISTEKRMKSTMSRYMDSALADQLLAAGAEVLGGKSATTTVLFSDVRNFTGISEELGSH